MEGKGRTKGDDARNILSALTPGLALVFQSLAYVYVGDLKFLRTLRRYPSF